MRDRLCIPRSDGQRGLIKVEGCVKKEKCSLAKYATEIKEVLVQITTAELNLEKYIVNVSKKENKENRMKEWKEKRYIDNK